MTSTILFLRYLTFIWLLKSLINLVISTCGVSSITICDQPYSNPRVYPRHANNTSRLTSSPRSSSSKAADSGLPRLARLPRESNSSSCAASVSSRALLMRESTSVFRLRSDSARELVTCERGEGGYWMNGYVDNSILLDTGIHHRSNKLNRCSPSHDQWKSSTHKMKTPKKS